MDLTNQDAIKQSNILIATFMGLEWIEEIKEFQDIKNQTFYKEVLYNSDWNLLIPVLDKIKSIDITPAPNWSGYRIEINYGNYVEISGFPMKTIFSNASIHKGTLNALYIAVVTFITEYNKTLK